MVFPLKIMLVLQKMHMESVFTIPISLTDLYCTLEVDSFGYFVNKAKTRVYRDTTEPNWNEVRLCFLLSNKFCLGSVATTRPDTLYSLNLGGSLRLPWSFLESAGGRSDVSKRFFLFCFPEVLIRYLFRPPPIQRNSLFCWKSVLKKNLKGIFALPLLLLKCLLGRFP